MKNYMQSVCSTFSLKSRTKIILTTLFIFSFSKNFSQTCGSYNYSNIITTNITSSLSSDKYYLSKDIDIIGDVSFNDIEMLIAPILQ